MKIILQTLFLLLFTYGVADAQNSVTVNQRGNNNKAVISQSATADSMMQSPDHHHSCYKMDSSSLKKGKNIVILKKGDGTGTNRYTVTGRSNNKLYLSQNGSNAKNGMNVWRNIDTLTATQHGAKNGIVLYFSENDSLKEKGNSYVLKQKGTGNDIYIGPCKEKGKKEPASAHSIKISQKGNGNTVSIDN